VDDDVDIARGQQKAGAHRGVKGEKRELTCNLIKRGKGTLYGGGEKKESVIRKTGGNPLQRKDGKNHRSREVVTVPGDSTSLRRTRGIPGRHPKGESALSG